MVESNSRSDQQKTEILKENIQTERKYPKQSIERQKDGRYGKVYERMHER